MGSNTILSLTLIIFLVILSFFAAGCALFEDRRGPPQVFGPREQVFTANFEEVWRAVNLVLQPYPLRVSNMDQGLLETDKIRGYKIWSPPYKPESANNAETYSLQVRVVKGNWGRHMATKVIVTKESELQVDFFSEPKNVASDGLEEKGLLYRVGREIQIERALTKAQAKHNRSQSTSDASLPAGRRNPLRSAGSGADAGTGSGAGAGAGTGEDIDSVLGPGAGAGAGGGGAEPGSDSNQTPQTP